MEVDGKRKFCGKKVRVGFGEENVGEFCDWKFCVKFRLDSNYVFFSFLFFFLGSEEI